MATRTKTNTPETDGKFNPSAVREVADGIPARTGRQRSTYDHWNDDVTELYQALGKAFRYPNTPNAQTEAAGVRRTYGIQVAVRDWDKTTKFGTLWLEIPTYLGDDGETLEVDHDKINANVAKYSK